MANRHLGRSVVLQTLFETDAMGGTRSKEDVEKVFLENVAEFAPDKTIFPFMKKLLDLVLSKYEELNEIIQKAAPEWPLEKIAIVDRNILRIGLAELLFADREQVPPKVAINEAIELAKEFGGDSSGKFVNGVLGAVYREMLESGIISEEETKPKELPKEELVGAVVYSEHEGEFYVALVHDIFGHWTLPKGKLQENETTEDGIKRKVQEELGLPVEVEDFLGENEYKASDPEFGKKIRHAVYHLAKAPFQDVKPKTDGGLDDGQWFKLKDIVDLNFYDDILPIITKAVNILASKKTK